MDSREFQSAVNGYLNQYIQLTDVKATAVAAAALVLIGLGLSDQAKDVEPALRIGGIILAGVSSVYALLAVLPRTPHSGSGHIFWADITRFGSAEEYWKAASALNQEDIGREYARQNFLVSGILITKTQRVRNAIIWFGVACISFALAVAVK
ncbi:Pycsar system effector family protein [Stenotrophomonas maltophilia]